MIRLDEKRLPSVAQDRKGRAILLLNGEAVGTVQARGGDTSWGFGDFAPNDIFTRYAPVFGAWSLLMHAEDDFNRLSREVKMELAKAEEMLDALRAQLFFVDEGQYVPVAQLAIEGDQLEWKEY